MGRPNYPIKDTFGHPPGPDAYQFIAVAATDTFQIAAVDVYGKIGGIYTITPGTSALTAQQVAALAGVSIDKAAYWHVLAVDGSVLVLPASQGVATITTSNGWPLTPGDIIGSAPGIGSFIRSRQELDRGYPNLNRYVFIGSASLTVVVEIADALGQTINDSASLTISTTAKSLEKFFSDAAITWPPSAAGMKILSITGAGSLHYNTGGNGIVGTNNGVTSGLEPTTASESVVAGTRFGSLA